MRKLKKIYSTFFLLPRNSFLTGAGSVFNIAGNYYRFKYTGSPEEADARAMENDWGVVGQDLLDVYEQYPVDKISSLKDF
jgi:hypothetical protein